MSWREDLHPRDARGRFAHKGSAEAAVTVKRVLAEPTKATTDEILDVFHRVSQKKKLDVKAIAILDAELSRREGRTDLAPADSSKQAAKVDRLVQKGVSYVDAYAEVYGADVDTLRAQEEYAMIAPRKGETTEQARRRTYQELVWLQYLQAEEATSGVLLSRRCAVKGVDPKTLWSAAPARAANCASDELKAFWEQQGGRMNYASFKAKMTGRGADRATAQASAGAGQGRDYGV